MTNYCLMVRVVIEKVLLLYTVFLVLRLLLIIWQIFDVILALTTLKIVKLNIL